MPVIKIIQSRHCTTTYKLRCSPTNQRQVPMRLALAKNNIRPCSGIFRTCFEEKSKMPINRSAFLEPLPVLERSEAKLYKRTSINVHSEVNYVPPGSQQSGLHGPSPWTHAGNDLRGEYKTRYELKHRISIDSKTS